MTDEELGTLAHDKMVDVVIKYLNTLLEFDKDAIEQLVEHRVVCNVSMLHHPSVMVEFDEKLPVPIGGFNQPKVGMLGILNGLFGVQPEGAKHPGWGYIAACYDDTTMKLTSFQRADR